MIKSLILTFVSLVIMAAANAEARQPVTAEAACSRINSNEIRFTCYNLIRNSYFNNTAVASCDAINDANDTVECLRAIANGNPQIDAVNACDRIRSVPLTIACLQAVAKKTYTNYEIRSCDAESDASATVRCFQLTGRSQHGGGHGGGYPPRPYPPTPTPGGGTCYVREFNRYVSGNEFFSTASEYARSHGTCVVARILAEPKTGRIYGSRGERIAKERGGLSNREADDILRAFGLYGCQRLTCQ